MSIVLVGSTSGSITLQEPAVAGTTVLTLPATSGTFITTGSSGQSIPSAALPTGSVLQVVQGSLQPSATIDTTSTSFITTNLAVSITPTSATSKIFVIATFPIKTAGGTTALATFYRNGSNIVSPHLLQHSLAGDFVTSTMQYLDSPASTSSQTYTVYFKSASASFSVGWGGNSYPFPLTIITAMEIAA